MTWSLSPAYFPTSDMDRLLAEVERWFQSGPAARGSRGLTPRLNAYANAEGLVVVVELPGLNPERLDLATHENRLILSGEVPSPEPREQETWHRGERFSGRFTRELTLPYRVDADKVKAEYRHGLLLITLPRLEADKPRKISVHAA